MPRASRAHVTLSAAVIAATLCLAGCGAGTSHPGGARTEVGVLGLGTATPGSTTSTGAGAGAASIDASAVLPDVATTSRLTLLHAEPGHDVGSNSDAGTVFTPTLAISVTGSDHVYAFDRTTGKVRWTTTVPPVRDGSRDDELCATPTPPPGATRMVVVVGTDCQRFDEIDLSDGRITGHYDSGRLFGLPQPSHGLTQVGAYTYWTDDDSAVRRIEADGTSSIVRDSAGGPLNGSAFGHETNMFTYTSNLIGGSYGDVLVVQTSHGGESALKAPDSQFFYGFRLDATSTSTVATQLWKRSVKDDVYGAHRNVDKHALAPESTFTGGHGWNYFGDVYNSLGHDAEHPRVARLTAFDTHTGALTYRATYRAGQTGGFPAWADVGGFEPSTQYRMVTVNDPVLGHLMYASSQTRRGTVVTAYDLVRDRVLWTYRPPRFRADVVASTLPVAVSADGRYLYVSVSDSLYSELVALDRTTGRPVHTWRVPFDAHHVVSEPVWFVDGDTVVLVDTDYEPYPATRYLGYDELAVYRFGPTGASSAPTGP